MEFPRERAVDTEGRRPYEAKPQCIHDIEEKAKPCIVMKIV